LKKGLFIFLAIFLVSCSSQNGNSIIGDKLTVYFDFAEDEALAEKIALYWKDNDLLTGQNQDLKIVRSGDNHVLKIIATETQQGRMIPFEQKKLLYQLETDLNKKVANSPLEIVICNSQFEPIFNVN